MDEKKTISDYISSQILGVLSTVNSHGKPESALVAITEVGDLGLFFGTYNTSRKYKNLKKNSAVAIALGNDVDEAITIQYEGVAEEVIGDEQERCKDLHIQKNPRSAKYAEKSEQRWFRVKPTWIRYSDLASNPQIEFELRP